MPNLITEEGGGLETEKSDYVICERPPIDIRCRMHGSNVVAQLFLLLPENKRGRAQ